jgi:hypothetical protein
MKKNLFIYILIICAVQAAAQDYSGKLTLSNGVEVSDAWPPVRNKETERKEMPVPYLENRQELIPINMGRQLFVDDFLIKSTNLVSVYHTPKYSSKNPVLEPDKEWEANSEGFMYAAPFSDGIWFDEKEQKFKMWYWPGLQEKACGRTIPAMPNRITGSIGLNQILESLAIQILLIPPTEMLQQSGWIKRRPDPSKRFKMFSVYPRLAIMC